MQIKKLFMTFLVNIFSFLPLKIQEKIFYSSNIHNTNMEFIVQPNSVWVGYEIINETDIINLLPNGLELTSTNIFPELAPKKYLFFNFFQVDTPFFFGHRLEIVTVVLEKKTGKKRFIILDYLTDTVSSDPTSLFKRRNCKKMKLNYNQQKLHCSAGNKYMLIAYKTVNKSSILSDEFAIDCNEIIYYAGNNNKTQNPNSLEFCIKDISEVYLFNPLCIFNNLWVSSRTIYPDIAFFYPKKVHFFIRPELS
jgi:hypothetical protein